MRLATWNVNSLNVRLPHVLKWLEENPIDVLCIQETKMTDDKFPQAAIEAAGYHVVFSGQKTYNGVAILSKLPIADVVKNNPLYEDVQQRIIAATIDGVRVVCAYVPNGQSIDSDKYQYKLGWLAAFHDWLKAEAAQHPQLAVVGDYNIAPEDRDVHDPVAWAGQVLCTPQERAHFQKLLSLGLHDAFRLFEQAPKSWSWWDYRSGAWDRDKGWRIDHIYLTDDLLGCATGCLIHEATRGNEQPSDHAPVVVNLA
eukprot:gene16786-16602_t